MKLQSASMSPCVFFLLEMIDVQKLYGKFSIELKFSNVRNKVDGQLHKTNNQKRKY